MTAVMGPLAWKARRDRALRWAWRYRAAFRGMRAMCAGAAGAASAATGRALRDIGKVDALESELAATRSLYAAAIDNQTAAVAHMNAALKRAEEAHKRALEAERERDEARAESRMHAGVAAAAMEERDAAEAALSRAREALVAIKAASDALHADAAEARSEGMPPRFRVTSRLDDAIEAGAALAAAPEPSTAHPEQHDDHGEHTTMAGHEEELP